MAISKPYKYPASRREAEQSVSLELHIFLVVNISQVAVLGHANIGIARIVTGWLSVTE